MAKATTPPNESDCWISLKNGNAKALGYLYDQYAGALFLSALRMTNDREMARDALQEVFVQLWNYRTTIGNISHTQAYLTRILRNILLKKLKQAQQTLPVQAAGLPAPAEISREEALIHLDTDKEKGNRLNRALSHLTSRQRLVLQLHYYEGLSHEQIASRLEINYQSVNNLIYRTIRHLRQLMAVLPVLLALLGRR